MKTKNILLITIVWIVLVLIVFFWYLYQNYKIKTLEAKKTMLEQQVKQKSDIEIFKLLTILFKSLNSLSSNKTWVFCKSNPFLLNYIKKIINYSSKAINLAK